MTSGLSVFVLRKDLLFGKSNRTTTHPREFHYMRVKHMHAIVRLGNGKYYISAVFGYYNNVKSMDDYQRYIERIHSPYYIVWDESKSRIVKRYAMQPNTKYLIPQVLIVDYEQDGWIKNDNGTGGVDFLPRPLADELSASGLLPQNIRDRCNLIEKQFIYETHHEIVNRHDIENLYCVSGGFHDAHIKEEKVLKDGALYLLFDGIWGCCIEMWLWGDVEYDTSVRHREEYDPYWFGSTLLKHDGFLYFIDEEDITVDQIKSGYCWFKARHIKYHVIPD
ncbi:MAG: hypothetical protein RSD08_07235 [Oscillospiraceae bacterium]